MRFLHSFVALLSVLLSLTCFTASQRVARHIIKRQEGAALQNIVTWDEHSIFVHGERVLVYSGEFHPFRLPVPSLWLDVFQKIRAMGYTAVSFYTDWALHEGDPGHFVEDGVFSVTQFMAAAKQAGIYLIARPGPYINAEVAGGGIPGWVQRVPGPPRTRDGGYLNATNVYADGMARTIAKGQITEGGPVILYQIENEYTFSSDTSLTFDPEYLQYIEDHARAAGIVVPFTLNDITPPNGLFAIGNGTGSVQIYGHDSYPLGFSCSNPTNWPPPGTGLGFPTDYGILHEQQSPSTPYALFEYQGGAVDGWGGSGYDNCALLVNGEAERLLYKAGMSFAVNIMNVYMTYGGTNWGNLGQPDGYTSYDYGAVISEDRTVAREKYGAAKLIATFAASSPDYLTADALNNTDQVGAYTNTNDIAITQMHNVKKGTRFFVVRHADYTSTDITEYSLSVPSLEGNITVPMTGGFLTLSGRDSKIHVVDYDLGGIKLWYSTAEIFSWQRDQRRTVVIVYGGPVEKHELAFASKLPPPSIIEGSGVNFTQASGKRVLSWTTSTERRIVRLGNVYVYIVDRDSAASYWRLEIQSGEPPYFANTDKNHLLINGGYLMRSASVHGRTLQLSGDLNASTDFEIVAGVPRHVRDLTFNGKRVDFSRTKDGIISTTLEYKPASISLPSLDSLDWKYIDSLPELSSNYDDSKWTKANILKSPNDEFNQTTPMSLSASDYGYHTGSILFRGEFNGTGAETSISLHTAGGLAYGSMVWLNGKFVGSWPGSSTAQDHADNYTLTNVTRGHNVLTVLVDHMGIDMQSQIGTTQFKTPRGILAYELSGHPASAITWKLTGNLGGERYMDKVRGPLNEGGLYFERQGYHYPKAPSSDWLSGSPTDGFDQPGVRFYYTSFDLNLPTGYDVPLYFDFAGGNSSSTAWRVTFYVNGYQFGRYVNNVGPQKSFPVPEGILNYHGTNYLGVALWAFDQGGDSVGTLELTSSQSVMTGMRPVALSPAPVYTHRPNAY